MAAIFVPGQFEKLHRVLTDAIASPARVANTNDWYIALDRSHADLADLARARPPSDAERREIQSGKVVIEGVTHSLNDDFAQQSIALAQHLDVSERYAASLLQAGMQARAKWGRSAIEVACILFHREKLAVVACLKELISGAATLQRDDEDPAARKLGAKMRQLVDALLAGKTYLPERVLREIDALKSSIEKTNQALRGIGQQLQPQQPQQQNASPTLGDEIQLQRLRMMRQQRQELGHVLYLLSASQCLASQGILAIVNWLAAVPQGSQQDAMVIYLVTVLLNALEPPTDDDDVAGTPLIDDIAFVKQIHQQLTTKTWMPEARSLTLLQWCLFLAEATKRSPGLANELKVHQDTLQKIFTDAVHGDALYFVVLKMLAFRQKEVDELEGEENDPTEMVASKANNDGTGDEEDIDAEFQEYVLLQVQSLVLALTSVMLPFVRRLQRSEEDASFALSRSGGSETNRRYDIEALFDTVALLCRAKPDAGLPFWLGPEGKGTRFLNWAIEVREPGHQRAIFDMLASLSAGKESAWHAHTLLSSGDGATSSSTSASPGQLMQQARFVSWTKLFDWVQQYIDTYRSPATQAHPVTSGQSAFMAPNEAVILRSFFRLLRNVVYYSVAAREALYQHTSYQVVPRLFTFYSCPIIIEVKAAILDALAAFAHPSGANTSKITNQLWTMIESALGVSSSSGLQRPNTSVSSLAAAHHALRAVEVPARIYPATTSLVNFFKSLIHVSQRINQQPIDVLMGSAGNAGTFQGLALSLGQGQRTPGLEPYVEFVVESVLLPAPTREYADPSERWRVTSACLDFLERCLCSFDMGTLLSGEDTDTAGLAALALHPGFSVMKRILTGTKLLNEILSILNPNAGVPGASAGFEVVNAEQANTLFFASCVRHSLRIVQRVLQLQDGFLQVLLPTLSDAGVQLPVPNITERIGHASLYTSLDSLLLHAHQSVVQMALYINCTRNDIALLAVRIIGLLAGSVAFSGVDRFGGMGYNRKMNRLVGLLEVSDEADRVRAGVVDRLEAEVNEVGSDIDSHVKATLALMRIAGQDDEEQLQGISAPFNDADEAIRLSLLDLMITNTAFAKDAPNIAHLLLGFDLRAVRAEEQIILDADAIDTPPSALHAILALLRPDPDGATMALAQRSPAFAEKCHLLLSNLCRHPYTSTATLRYLRTKENFFARQLRTMSFTPVKRSSSEFGALGTIVQPDGGHLQTTVDALVASLQIRGHILGGTALELHMLCNAGMWAEANALIAVLVGRDSVLDAGNGTDDEGDFYEDSIDGQHFDQRGIRLLEILTSLDFEWCDARDDSAQEPTVLSNLDLSQALSQQHAREYDVQATLRLLAAARRELDRRGDLTESRQRAEFDKDASLILEHISSRNARRVIALARRSAMQSWRSTLDMTFSRANHLLRSVSRAGVILDCLGALLPRLSGSSGESDPALADVIAGAVLGLLTRLRHHQSEANNDDDLNVSELPVDRVLSVLRALTAAIMEPGTSMQARGNLYSALINYLQLVKGIPVEETDTNLVDDDDSSTLDAGSEIDDSLSYAGFSASPVRGVQSRGKRASQAESRSRTLLASQAERLVPIVARDALDAADVWRTVAFTLFDRLTALQGTSTSSRTLLLDILAKRGFLKSFVANIREMDMALQDVLRPDPSSLNAIYVYEASMAFFSRLAQSRRGAERLVDARIFDVLSQVDFLQARPQQQYPYAEEDEFDDVGSFLPAITSRYESLLLPALQLSVSILFNSNKVSSRMLPSLNLHGRGSSASTPAHAVARQALSFLQAHRSTLLASLKNATTDTVSLASLEQAQLVVNMLVFVLPILDDDALSAPKPLSHFHHSALALSANFLYEPHWQSRIVPHTEAEREEAILVVDPSQGTEGYSSTVFDTRARDAVQRLLATLLAYLERASECSGVDEQGRRLVRPCLTSSLYTHPSRGVSLSDDVVDLSGSSTGPGRYGLRAGRSAHVASLGTALASLDESIKRSNEAFLTLDKMQGMLDNADNVRLDEWDDILAFGSAGSGADAGASASGVPPAQRKMLALQLLRTHCTARRRQLLYHLNSIEMLLTILTRHFAYYLELGAADATSGSGWDATGGPASLRPNVSATAVSSSAMPAHEVAALTRDGSKICGKVLEKLDDVLAWLESQLATASSSSATIAGTYAPQQQQQQPVILHADERRAFMSMTARRLQGLFSERLEGI